MRQVFYIIAPTSSGKTTSSKRLSKDLGIPLYHADNIYNMLADTYPINCLPEKLT
jgi:dephospho-CoA kinase